MFHVAVLYKQDGERAMLANITGQLSRPQVVKKLWEHIKGNDLQDPKDKRQIICDEKMQAVFKQSRVDMFRMNKEIGNHLYPVGEDQLYTAFPLQLRPTYQLPVTWTRSLWLHRREETLPEQPPPNPNPRTKATARETGDVDEAGVEASKAVCFDWKAYSKAMVGVGYERVKRQEGVGVEGAVGVGWQTTPEQLVWSGTCLDWATGVK
ncbi:hypothetical protein NM208_g15251 [Fusarium decemcellulare]|uniref:Uncharacterized protein n=1 Tax=Fusarium decemcellulare TaxID=57161 RepID=A0ACC1RE31_9HYPO|nr:hypothetical protein NM208_g15251 [Fusarium decemcellulare]